MMATSWDRTYTYIRGNPIRHNTCSRDFICACGSRLTTRWFADAPLCRTVCAADPEPGPDDFITKGKAEYERHVALVEELAANEILSHLPPELQAVMLDK